MKKGSKVALFNWCYLAQESFKSPVITLVNQDLTNSSFIYSVKKRLGSKTQKFNAIIIDQSVTIPELKLPLGIYEHELLWVNESSRNVVFQGTLTIADKGENSIGCMDEIAFEIVTENKTIEVLIEGKGDRGENGWTPIFSFENIDGKIVKKLIDYDLGTGNKPTLYINEYVAENGYTTNIEQALNFKGDAFRYEDFTPEEIARLKQPAIDAAEEANQATVNANNAIQLAEDATQSANQSAQYADIKAQSAEAATQLANEATENANQATVNAHSATNNAINATESANQATNNAISATNEANQATQNANSAADNANNARGWNPYYVFESDGPQRLVKKLADWIGGTGNKPTQNVGQYVTDSGTYTSVKSEAANFRGAQSDNLIYEYVKTGNKEVVVDYIDYSTNTIYSSNHGLINSGTNINNSVGLRVIFNEDGLPDINKLPYLLGSRLYVINATQNTFQLSTLYNGEPISFVNQLTVDYNVFKFETYGDTVFNFNGLPNVKKLIFEIDYKLLGKGNSYRINGLNKGFVFGKSPIYNAVAGAWLFAPQSTVTGDYSIGLELMSDGCVMTQNLSIISITVTGYNSSVTSQVSLLPELKNLTNITLRDLSLMNGATIRIYKG